MKRTVLKLTALTLSAMAVFVISNRNTQAEFGAAAVAPQEKPVEQTRKNIKVLTGLPDSQLIPVMNFMSASLGRRCNFCHITDKGRDGFALDDKPEKNTAREMIKMVMGLHKQSFPGASEISCFTCHRGQNHPVNVPPLPLPTPLPRPPATPSPTPGAAGTLPGTTQESPPPSPTADTIYNNYITAIGGQANVDKIKTRTVKGAVAQPNGTVTIDISQGAPDKFHIKAMTPGGAFERGFNGSAGWEKGPQGVRPLSPAEVAQLQNSMGLLRHIRLKEQFTSMRARGNQKIGDRVAYLVIGTTADNRQERLFFDTQTGLLLRRISYMATLLGLIPEQIDFEDYRDVDGVKFPFTVRVSSIEVGNPVSTRTFSEMKLNAPVSEAIFNMPAATP
ncbi:MAG TPA: c-type cytochrome [Pyrinomonadaceae bacterium]|nr:c-type cytochrome [Pyrinomonadaceae bacterium]